MPVTEWCEALCDRVDAQMAEADARLADQYPGEAGGRQPVHTLYVPADRFSADAAAGWGRQALDLLDEHLAGAADLAGLLEIAVPLAERVLPRVTAKLATEPVEDVRVDLEDGYGHRGDLEEDGAAAAAARALAQSIVDHSAPVSVGLRFKSLEASSRRRGLRSLALFLDELLAHAALPAGFVLTLPKVTSVAQVAAMVDVCEALEAAHALPPGRLRFELQIETPQSVLASDGTATVARLIHAGAGRVSGLHYGTYDYSACLGIAAAWQSLEHPVADHAKAVMQVAAAGTGVRLSDGSTNVLPVGSAEQVRAAWRLHARLVQRSLQRGFYQGWDLHPGQLPTRYAATYAFFLGGLDAATARLGAYLDRRDSGVLDEPATAAALAAFLIRGVDCGAFDAGEVLAAVGLDLGGLTAIAQRSSLVQHG
jgi:citrate lyase beta subunit